jgi:hypothetical protein
MESKYPWRNEETFREVYWEEGLSQSELAERWGCSTTTVETWMENHNIEGRHHYNTPASFYTTERGYEFWSSPAVGLKDRNQEYLRVHRLLAVSKYGFEAVKDTPVHHRNRIPWLNTYDNIELMTEKEHGKIHAEEAKVERDEQGRWV